MNRAKPVFELVHHRADSAPIRYRAEVRNKGNEFRYYRVCDGDVRLGWSEWGSFEDFVKGAISKTAPDENWVLHRHI